MQILFQAITLEDFIFKKKIFPNILKIDVEGSELSVVKGAKSYLKIYKPIIFLSIHVSFLKEKCIKLFKGIELEILNK